MSFTDILPYIQVFGQIALIAAASFAGFQLILHRKERQEHAALAILTNIQTPEFRIAYAHVWTLPLKASEQDIEELDTESEEAIGTIAMTFESIGVLVYNRIVPLHVVDDVIGGFLRESWRRLEPHVQRKRRELGASRYAEWYQWLAEQLDVRHKRRTVPAHEAFRAWKE